MIFRLSNINFKRAVAACFFVIVGCIGMWANDYADLIVKVKDDLTRLGIPAHTMVVFSYEHTENPDSAELVYKDKIMSNPDGVIRIYNLKKGVRYELVIFATKSFRDEVSGKVIIGEDITNYEPTSYSLTIPMDAKETYEAPPVILNRKRVHELKEMTVSATKVMFYHKGDTLVFNADAFVLAEGSMLDALIAKMPGVELKPGGQITVKGRNVKQLLVNGKDLFNGNNELILSNLAAHTIKDVAVYNKRGRVSKLMNRNLAEDTEYVMDVRLKREYSQGWIFNAEGGYGSRSKYLGRLFASWFSDFVSVSAFGNVNNLNDLMTPGSNAQSWMDPMKLLNGERTVTKGGIQYNASGYDEKWELKGGINAEDTKRKSETRQNVESYLPDNTIYNHNISGTDNRNITISTNHVFYAPLGSRAYIELTPEFNYLKWKSDSRREMVSALTSLDSLINTANFHPFLTDWHPNDKMINCGETDYASEFTQYKVEFSARSNIRLNDKRTPSRLDLRASGRYIHKDNRIIERQSYRYSDPNLTPTSTNRFRNISPDNSQNYDFRANYIYYGGFYTFTANYGFNHGQSSGQTAAYMLNLLDDYTPGEYSLSHLPSETELLKTIDTTQSDRSFSRDDSHQISASIRGQKLLFFGKHSLQFDYGVKLGANVANRHYSYEYMQTSSKIDKITVLPDCNVSIGLHTKNRTNNLAVSYIGRAADLSYFVDRASTSDLVRQFGNNDLKNQYSWNFNFESRQWSNAPVEHNFSGFCNIMNNSIALTQYFNLNSGKIFLKPWNINGNLNAEIKYNLFAALNKSRTLSLSNNLSLKLNKSVDYSMAFESFSDDSFLDANATQPKSTVRDYNVSDRLDLRWQKGIVNLSAFADIRFNRYIHKHDNFSAWTCNYGATGVVTLPHNWSISTDMTLYTRRGYEDTRVNRTDLVWNARVSKSILKGSLVFMLDGYDMLHQLSNVTYSVNAQARTETITNVIPSYILFHLQWHFNKQPKR